MGSRVQIRKMKKIIGGDMNASDINSMFDEMMGIKDADKDIILPKFIDARNLIRGVYRILTMLGNFKAIRDDFHWLASSMDEILKFAKDMRESVVFADATDDCEENYDAVDKESMNKLYKSLKENTFVKQIFIMGNRLKQYDVFLKDVNQLQDNFIGIEPGLSLVIFEFSTLDLKRLWADNKITPLVRNYMLQILHKLYTKSRELFKIITSPDVDVDKFAELLISSINHLKKQPKLNRCNNAFRKIEESVQLLKDNFDQYYRESIACSNPNIILENFIVDVSNKGGVTANLTREFGQIINYMRELSTQNGRAKDPRIQQMFKMLDRNYKLMETSTSSASVNAPTDATQAQLANITDSKNNLDELDTSVVEPHAGLGRSGWVEPAE